MVVIAFAMASPAAALTDSTNKEAKVNVTIASTTSIDLHPQQLDFTGGGIGTAGSGETVGSQVTQTDRGFTSVELENTGSEYIDRIWVNSTQSTNQDAFFGTGTTSNFNAGNMLQVRPASNTLLQGDTSEYNFVNRREYGTYNNSLIPSYINAPPSGEYNVSSTTTQSSPNEIAVGRLRVGNNEWFWAMPTSTRCDGQDTYDSFLLARAPHNSSYTRPIDFTVGGGYEWNGVNTPDFYLYNISTTGSSYGSTNSGSDGGNNGITLSLPDNGGEREFDILTKCDTNGDSSTTDVDAPHAIRTRYNVEAGNNDNLATDAETPRTQFLLKTNTGSEMLQPGQTATIDVAVEVPRGIPQGFTTEGSFRVIVRADTSQT